MPSAELDRDAAWRELLGYLRVTGWRCRDCKGRILLVDGFGVCENGCGALIPLFAQDRKALVDLGRFVEVANVKKVNVE